MQVVEAARKHGFSDADIRHAFENAMRFKEVTYRGEEQIALIGATPNGTLLELIAVPADGPTRIIHANRLTPKFHDMLMRG